MRKNDPHPFLPFGYDSCNVKFFLNPFVISNKQLLINFHVRFRHLMSISTGLLFGKEEPYFTDLKQPNEDLAVIGI